MGELIKFIGLCFLGGAAAAAGAVSLGIPAGEAIKSGTKQLTERVTKLVTRKQQPATTTGS